MVYRHLLVDSVFPYFFVLSYLFIFIFLTINLFVQLCLTIFEKDILTLAITEFSDTFTKAMNRDDVSFKSQYIYIGKVSSY